MDLIDLRSDTVTRPSPGMRDAMASAEVGDDQFGEDPTINRLQERVAQLLGKEAALWVPTGTMANQVALRVSTRPGDDVIVARESHAMWHETGAAAANAGIQMLAQPVAGVWSMWATSTASRHSVYRGRASSYRAQRRPWRAWLVTTSSLLNARDGGAFRRGAWGRRSCSGRGSS